MSKTRASGKVDDNDICIQQNDTRMRGRGRSILLGIVPFNFVTNLHEEGVEVAEDEPEVPLLR